MDPRDRAWLGEDLDRWATNIRNGWVRVFGYHALYETGVLEALRRAGAAGRTSEELGRECGVDPWLLDGMLRYLALADTTLERDGERFKLGPEGDWLFSDDLKQIADLVTSYGSLLTELLPALRGEKRYGVDFVRVGDKVAKLSERVSRANYPWIVKHLERLDAKVIADLGCGAAGVLISFCKQHPSLCGIGVDVDPGALEEAARNVAEAGLSDRIRLVQGDISQPDSYAAQVKDADAFSCIAVLHEFLRDGEGFLESVLRRMKALFPGRYFFPGEYNALGDDEFRKLPFPDRMRKLYYQHIVHPLSQQGLPMSRARWVKLFERAGLEVLEVTPTYFEQYLTRF